MSERLAMDVVHAGAHKCGRPQGRGHVRCACAVACALGADARGWAWVGGVGLCVCGRLLRTVVMRLRSLPIQKPADPRTTTIDPCMQTPEAVD